MIDIRPEMLGDPSFKRDLGIRYAYLGGAMANGIGSVEICQSLAGAGMLGFFGAAGLSLQRVESAIDALRGVNCGFNLIHTPNEPAHEAATVALYLRRGVRLVEASAYLDLTLPLARYRLSGIHAAPDGSPICPNRVVGKVSRVEVATRFLSPAPDKLLGELVREGTLTESQAALARRVPVAQDLTAEADSGGHTDNRPFVTLLPTLIALRDRMQAKWEYPMPLRIGAAGGIATPESVAAAFLMGAAYVLAGSIHQACRESGSSDAVREMLAGCEQADVTMAPAADMFEMGVKLQVLKRGTMFAMRAAKLHELYRAHPSLEAIPEADRSMLEKTIFRLPLSQVWDETKAFWRERGPEQLDRADRDPKHRLALAFRWYLGLSSRWANSGEPSRKVDYQVWCGPAMGAFNEWTRGSYLEDWRERRVADVARELMHGACVRTRQHFARLNGEAITEPVRPVGAERLRTAFA
ncbi:MAG: PfaD family polyunsaturated fatty acid/polyketide biosynthesis protein [Gemmataceae bacterium]|nr:PfaD family polyunsaturated fatty acid/polyketide biosynthesis protein [Gemmataceae bacterium]